MPATSKMISPGYFGSGIQVKKGGLTEHDLLDRCVAVINETIAKGS